MAAWMILLWCITHRCCHCSPSPCLCYLPFSPRLFGRLMKVILQGPWTQCMLGKHHTWSLQADLRLGLRGLHLHVNSIISSLCTSQFMLSSFSKKVTHCLWSKPKLGHMLNEHNYIFSHLWWLLCPECITVLLPEIKQCVPLLGSSEVDLYDDKTWDSYFVVLIRSGVQWSTQFRNQIVCIPKNKKLW